MKVNHKKRFLCFFQTKIGKWPANASINKTNVNLSVIYEVCPKSNETGVIKTVLNSIEIYQSQIPSK